ncbi:unnamed protein product [Cyclocybe aegerita]|uniref:pyridoxal 5'-phosphate synthase n=1 Tax=Cyclocybe aegerita TaxID=1973307 RepID=A0A8S0VU22_CYCAE|nr:unnamed protein product [Cyclocybe aegerita]
MARANGGGSEIGGDRRPLCVSLGVMSLAAARVCLSRYRIRIPRLHRSLNPSHMDVVLSEPAPDKLQVLPHIQYVTAEHLAPGTVASNPLDQFRGWFKDAIESGKVDEAEAMSLSTATPNGIPSARIVLLKQVDARGFVFFTNYTSRKSQEIIANPHAALVFYWREIHKSVRVVGRVEKITREESDEYFQSRPLGSRLGAWASKQSSVIPEDAIEARLQRVSERFGENVPTPEFWGGWRVVPE